MPVLPDPIKTPEEIAKEQAIALNELANNALESAKLWIDKMYNHFWNNPEVTPAELMAVYGTDGFLLFSKMSSFSSAVKVIDPAYEVPTVPDKYEYVVNPDGSVTITEKVVEP
jgi:hypothetical protein